MWEKRGLWVLSALAAMSAACSQQPSSTADGQGEASEAPPVPVQSSAPVADNSEPANSDDASQDVAERGQSPAASQQSTIPARFHGKWAESRESCAIPGHQVYRISAARIGFFESTGVVEDVTVDANAAGVTITEQYGDAPPSTYMFYLALEGADAMRVRYDKGSITRVVRCPG